jgi:hypothetical protein
MPLIFARSICPSQPRLTAISNINTNDPKANKATHPRRLVLCSLAPDEVMGRLVAPETRCARPIFTAKAQNFKEKRLASWKASRGIEGQTNA